MDFPGLSESAETTNLGVLSSLLRCLNREGCCAEGRWRAGKHALLHVSPVPSVHVPN